MNASKAKIRQERTINNKASIKLKKFSPEKPCPSEEDIREKAEDFYHQRIDRGEYGTAENDWLNAEKYLTESID